MITTTTQPLELIAQTADTHPHPFMIDQPIAIHLSGFTPGQPVTIHAFSTPEDGVWRSQASFLADANGCVDVTSQAPLVGSSYSAVDAMGLFWSMQPDPGAASTRDNCVKLTATQGEQMPAVATIERLWIAPGVTKTLVREEGLYGTLMVPPGEGPHPGLLVLGGSVGGLPETFAQMFASHGYATLALAYFRYEELPGELQSIPLEYFQTALQWMQSQASIQSDQIGVYGISKGGELALLLGSTFPQIKAVVGIVPSAVVWQGLDPATGFGRGSSWSFQGQDLPYIPFALIEKFGLMIQKALQERTPVSLTPLHLYSLEHTAIETIDQATIRVENIQGPVLVVSGEDDQLWPSSLLADRVIARLAQHQHPYPYQHLKYQGAGHFLTFPYQPTTINSSGGASPFQLAMGGNPSQQTVAVRDAWPQILEFLERSLSR
jgi:dienelactone hydrolase